MLDQHSSVFPSPIQGLWDEVAAGDFECGYQAEINHLLLLAHDASGTGWKEIV
jgi:hypothetical protein